MRVFPIAYALTTDGNYSCWIAGYPLATRQEPLDLDKGVKVNYAKHGAPLKKIPGLDSKDEE